MRSAGARRRTATRTARIAERGLSSYPDFPLFNADAAVEAAQLGRKEEAHRYIEPLRRGTTEITAMRDIDPADVRFGSIAAEALRAGEQRMSALPRTRTRSREG